MSYAKDKQTASRNRKARKLIGSKDPAMLKPLVPISIPGTSLVYRHRDHDIIYRPDSATFAVCTKTKVLVSTSLAGVKAQLDNKLGAELKPFRALDASWDETQPKSVLVVGVARVPGETTLRWKIESGSLRRAIYPDTPKARRILKELRALLQKEQEMEKTLRDTKERMRREAGYMEPTLPLLLSMQNKPTKKGRPAK